MFRKKAISRSPRRPHPTQQHSQPVFSYHSARKESDRQYARAEQPAHKIAHLKRKLKHVPYALSFAAICAALLYNLTLMPKAQIVVSGDQVILRSSESYQQAIDSTLKSSIMNRSKITINTERLSGSIRAQFPEIESLNVSLPLLRHEPIIEVRLAPPAAILATPNRTYVLNANGRAMFDKQAIRYDYDISKLPVITDPSGHPIIIGETALTSEQIAYANLLIGQTSHAQLVLESMTLQAGGEELHVRFKELPYAVKFSFGADARQSFGAFIAAKERSEHDKSPAVEYIDVRIAERAYVK